MTADQTGYGDVIAVIDALPVLVRETRRRRGMSLRQTAEQVGVQFATVSRLERGHAVHSTSLIALLRWVATPDGEAS